MMISYFSLAMTILLAACVGCGQVLAHDPNSRPASSASQTASSKPNENEIVAGHVQRGSAVAIDIENPGFEQGWRGWRQVNEGQDDTAISDVARSGNKSGKITSAGGRFEQHVAIHPDSDYELTAYISGAGAVGIVGGETLTAKSLGDGENWVKVILPFDSGTEREIRIFGDITDGTARFDDFVLTAIGGQALVIEAEKQKAALQRQKVETRNYATLEGACRDVSDLKFALVQDDRGSEDGPVDAATSGKDVGQDLSKQPSGTDLTLDFGSVHTLKEIGIAWQVSEREAVSFDVAHSLNGKDYSVLIENRKSTLVEPELQRYDVDDTLVRFLRVTTHGSENGTPIGMSEIAAYGCGSRQFSAQPLDARAVGSYGLKTNVAPSQNFDLRDWKLTLPVDRDNDGKADEITEQMLAEGWSDPALFFTDPVTGGMVFRTPQKPLATTIRSNYRRTELREMLRAGNMSIDATTKDGTPNKNNWVLPSAPPSARARAGGVGGVLRATLAVNQVTRLGNPEQVGRVIIGQIHGKDQEPARLYYRKLPNNKYGSIYYTHETPDKKEIYVDMIGDHGDYSANPRDGIALDEVFSYEISVKEDIVDGVMRSLLNVKITRDDGTEVKAKPLDLSDSGYATDQNFLYFKAGSYQQNSSSSWLDHHADQVTFFKLENSH